MKIPRHLDRRLTFSTGWKILFVTSWGRFERRFNHILEDLNRHGALLDKQANALNIAESRQMRATLQEWKEKSLIKMEGDEKHQQARDFDAVLAWMKLDDSEQITLLDSVSVDKTTYPGTSAWLLQHKTIKTWLKQTPESQFLWLYGNPGTGKSTISAELVNWLQSSNAAVIYHFCAYTYTSSTQYEGVLRSLLVQILRNEKDLVYHVYQEYVLKRKPATISTLDQLLETVILARSHEPRQQQCLWILIDALNECESAKQQRLASLLHQLSTLSSNQTIVKVLITARKLPVMIKRFQRIQVLSLSDEERSLTSAIRIYASCRLKLMEARLRQIEVETEEIEEIERLVAEKAHGMFLYARLVLDYISSNVFYDGDELKASVHQLPQTLAEFYNKLLMQILKNLDDRSQSRVQAVFNWIAFAKRPLRKMELLSALAFSDGNPEVNKIAPSYILDDTCSPLLSQRHDTTFGFIHATVKDYLQSDRSPFAISESDATRQQCIASSTCLLSGLKFIIANSDPQTRLLRLVRGLHAFHVYATEHWTDYLLTAANDNVNVHSSVFGTATRLASTLELTSPAPSAKTPIDDKLNCLAPHPLLMKHVSWALRARSQARLDQDIIGSPEGSTETPILDGISIMLTAYQAAVEQILNIDSLPGVSSEELDVFKSQFRASAYTCRLRSCARATLGFENAELRYEHELNHTSGFRCPATGCQFPPCRSAQALRTHTKKHHTPQSDWRPIRRQQKQVFPSPSPESALHDLVRDPQKQSANTTSTIDRRKRSRMPEYTDNLVPDSVRGQGQHEGATTLESSAIPLVPNPTLRNPAMGVTSLLTPTQQYVSRQDLPETNIVIARLTKRLMEEALPWIRDHFQSEVDDWSEETRNNLLSQGIDPLFFRFTQQAEKMLHRGKISPKLWSELRSGADSTTSSYSEFDNTTRQLNSPEPQASPTGTSPPSAGAQFKCDLCYTGYLRQTDYENHLRSCSHDREHRQRLAEMKNLTNTNASDSVSRSTKVPPMSATTTTTTKSAISAVPLKNAGTEPMSSSLYAPEPVFPSDRDIQGSEPFCLPMSTPEVYHSPSGIHIDTTVYRTTISLDGAQISGRHPDPKIVALLRVVQDFKKSFTQSSSFLWPSARSRRWQLLTAPPWSPAVLDNRYPELHSMREEFCRACASFSDVQRQQLWSYLVANVPVDITLEEATRQ
jgi:archaellum biogenesis ATPase FlaH